MQSISKVGLSSTSYTTETNKISEYLKKRCIQDGIDTESHQIECDKKRDEELTSNIKASHTLMESAKSRSRDDPMRAIQEEAAISLRKRKPSRRTLTPWHLEAIRFTNGRAAVMSRAYRKRKYPSIKMMKKYNIKLHDCKWMHEHDSDSETDSDGDYDPETGSDFETESDHEISDWESESESDWESESDCEPEPEAEMSDYDPETDSDIETESDHEITDYDTESDWESEGEAESDYDPEINSDWEDDEPKKPEDNQIIASPSIKPFVFFIFAWSAMFVVLAYFVETHMVKKK